MGKTPASVGELSQFAEAFGFIHHLCLVRILSISSKGLLEDTWILPTVFDECRWVCLKVRDLSLGFLEKARAGFARAHFGICAQVKKTGFSLRCPRGFPSA